jgi:two-component system, NarL family, sensor kinase
MPSFRVPHEVYRFALVLTAVSTVVGLGVFAVMSQEAIGEAQKNAEDLTRVKGLGIVQPVLSDSLLTGDPAELATLDQTVRQRVLDGRTVRVKVWDPSGRILYSDKAALIGLAFPLGNPELQALRSNRSDSYLSDLSKPENQYERSFGQLLEVYFAIQTPSGQKVLFETYQEFASVQAQQARIMLDFGPILIGGLLLLLLLVLPIAWSMATRLQSAAAEREALLTRAVDASDGERRRIARDLHDGVVQRLAGTGMSLAAAAEMLDQASDPKPDSKLLRTVRTGAAELRVAVRELRTLIVQIAPVGLTAGGLTAALEDLADPLRTKGIQVEVRMEAALRDQAEVQLIFRVAQEALRNASRHSAAKIVKVELLAADAGRRLTITDDGVGFEPGALVERRQDGHMGLTLLDTLASDGGATLRVVTAPGEGTRIEMSLR